MSKFAKSMTEVESEYNQPQAKCQSCGWDFSNKIPQEVVKGDGTKSTRILTRQQINVPLKTGGLLIRCNVCYESELYGSGKARYSDHPEISGMHVRSIRTEQSW